ncbi:UNVERIFIED_CONTAM: Glutathione S-transferase T1 [Sesamum radiatum]|uniref:Glutathione S-transferase T1 n=1 Tax=Sesamum radiatum TaxID=300843 RepID=A0AAW2TX97_SESRA
MELKLYVDRLSQPSRALLIFCKANGIEFEEVSIQLGKLQHRSPQYAEINPMKQVPAIVHGDFKLSESHSILIYLASAFPGVAEHCHAILIYLASAFPGVADHWYPADVQKRAKIHSVLDWHHSNLRRGSGLSFEIALSVSVEYLFNTLVAPEFGLPLDQKAADEDIALVCEIMQLEVADEKDRDRILGGHERVLKWIGDTKNATAPYFDEIHSIMPSIKDNLKELKA